MGKTEYLQGALDLVILDIVTFGSVMLAMTLATLVTTWAAARRTLDVHPLEVLKHD